MTVWEFIDRRLPKRPSTIAGAGIFGLSLVVIVMLFAKPELGDSDLFKMLAQAIVAQGLVGLAMAYYFTAKSTDNRIGGKPDDPVQ